MDDATLNTLKSWIGRSITLHSDLPVFGAQALAGAINHTEAPGTGDPLPLPWHWLYFLDPTRRDSTGEDGHPRKGRIPAAGASPAPDVGSRRAGHSAAIGAGLGHRESFNHHLSGGQGWTLGATGFRQPESTN